MCLYIHIIHIYTHKYMWLHIYAHIYIYTHTHLFKLDRCYGLHCVPIKFKY